MPCDSNQGKLSLRDLRISDVRIFSFHDFKITAVLAGDRIETFTFNSREELKESCGFGRTHQTRRSQT